MADNIYIIGRQYGNLKRNCEGEACVASGALPLAGLAVGEKIAMGWWGPFEGVYAGRPAMLTTEKRRIFAPGKSPASKLWGS